ncbi:hypothetical protein Tco_1030256 [Tanacetum coccineum]|uniref:Uncharacterized protein n=1 Tax=Tanacetum coccineum TaxID=301880 RepID=A0ABQ5G5P9_9ASTR
MIVESTNANNSKPNHTWGSNATDVPSSSSLVNDRLSRLFFGSRDTNLYTISLDDMLKTSLIYLLSKVSKTKSWLWHHRLSHLNFGKSKKSSHQPKAEDINQEKLYLLHMDLYGPMRVRSIVGIKRLLEVTTAQRYKENKESKKAQRTILKQQYENFEGLSSETIDQTIDRLQKLIGQLEVHGEVLEQEDINLKLLRSLPSEWKMLGLKDFKMILRITAAHVYIKVMEFESAQSNTTAKLPILKLDEYEMWVIRIKQYFQNGTSVTKMSVPVTAEEKTNKKNDVKARSLLLMALPNEHQLTFSQYTDAKTIASSAKSLDSIFNKLQKIMNKVEIEIMGIDDLYNNFKIVEQKVRKYVGASSGAQNIAFMTAPSTSSTNDVNTAIHAYEVSTASPNINTASPQVSTASFSDNDVNIFEVAALSAKYEGKKGVVKHLGTRRSVRKNHDNTRRHGNNEDINIQAMDLRLLGFEWFMAPEMRKA